MGIYQQAFYSTLKDVNSCFEFDTNNIWGSVKLEQRERNDLMKVEVLAVEDGLCFRWRTEYDETRLRTKQDEPCRLSSFRINANPGTKCVEVFFIPEVSGRSLFASDLNWIVKDIEEPEDKIFKIHTNRSGPLNDSIHLWIVPGKKTSKHPMTLIPIVARYFFQEVFDIPLETILCNFSVIRMRRYKVRLKYDGEGEESQIFWWDEAEYLCRTSSAYE